MDENSEAELLTTFKAELKRLMQFGLSLDQATEHVHGQIRFLHELKVRERRMALRIVAGKDCRE